MFDVRESWTDERLDDFRGEVNRRFDGVDQRLGEVDRRFDKVDRRFDKVDVELQRMNDRLDTMGRVMIQGFVAMTGAIVAGFGGMAALIATQL
jgi:hypothetical protein